jgi:hypothetical protein
MKIPLIYVMMTLAIVFGLSVSAMAQQGNGLAPSTAYWAIEGAVTTHTITSTGSATTWNVLIVSDVDADIGEAGTAATLNTHYAIETAGTDDAISIRWLQVAGVDELYAVESVETATTGGCTTRRRSYVGVYGFEVDVLLATVPAYTDADADADFSISDTWCGDVVNSDHDATEISLMDAALINNPTDNEAKTTDTYYRVSITLTGAPTGFSLNSLKWRFKYSIQSEANLDVYQITAGNGAEFGSEGGAASIGGTAVSEIDFTLAANNMVYIPFRIDGTGVNTFNYNFTMTHHNILSSDPTTYQIQIDEVNVEYTAETDYDNGTKYHTSVAPANMPALSDGQTGTQTINHGPATTTITITD